MKRKIGKYTISRRTEYSKIVILDNETNEDILTKDVFLSKNIVNDYELQRKNPDDYFNSECI